MDTISNMLISLKNGGNAKKPLVSVPFSNIKVEIAKKLLSCGYIASYDKQSRKHGAFIDMTLVYDVAGNAAIHDVKRVSKPSKRVYTTVKELKPFRNGNGQIILSTPKGIMTDEEAKKALVGGEVLFTIW